MPEKKPIGKILLQQRALTATQLDQALAGRKPGRLASRLTEDGVISDVSALKALSEQYGVPGIELGQICIRLEDLELLPREIAEKHRLLPVLIRGDRIFCAMADPRERKVIDELEFVTAKKVYPYVALETALSRVIDIAYSRKAQGDDYYVAPRCPATVLEKLGIDARGRPLSQESEPAASPTFGSQVADNGEAETPPEPDARGAAKPLDAPGVVVDDAVDTLSRRDEIEEDGFGETSRDLSIVTNLPEHELSSGPHQDQRTVLVVDDEAEIRKLLKRLLIGQGHRVLEADRGLLALKLVKEHAPDLIILDAMLPEVHGFDIARRIKGSKRYGHIPIVMVSAVYRGWRYAEDLKQSCGVEHFIEKPFRIADITRAVQSSLTGRDAAADEARVAQLSRDAEGALRAGVEAYRVGRLDDAVEHLKRGLEIDPLAYRLHLHLGLLYGRKGQVYEAIGELETAVEINSSHFPAAKNLAILYQKAGFRNKAAETWERALKLSPDEATSQSIKQHLLTLL